MTASSGDAKEWLQEFSDRLERVCEGDLSVSFQIDHDDPAAEQIAANMAKLVERIDAFHLSSMELALGLSESFEVLAAIRENNYQARVSDTMLTSAEELVAQLGHAINTTAEDLQIKMETIERQQEAIRLLSTPILKLWDNVLVLPVVGVVDSARTSDIMDRLLGEIVSTQSQCVIIDITGVDVVDTRTADNFIKMVKAAELVGARCILTGISPAVAQTLIDIGVDMGSIVTLRNLQDGLRECIRYLEARRSASPFLGRRTQEKTSD